jgi:hypothetical protein
MLVYNTQNYWVFGLCPSFVIPETREHSVPNSGEEEIPTTLGPLERANLNSVTEVSSSKGTQQSS